MKIKAIVAAALLAVGGVASAADTNWGNHDAFEIGFNAGTGAGSLISDKYSFSLASTAGVLAVAVSNDGGILNLAEGLVTLFKVGEAAALGSFSFDSAAVNYSFGSLAAGEYFYTVSAKVAPGALAGTYQLNSQLAPVPEPETYALMLAGLAAVGFVARRRSIKA
ncbi:MULTISPECIES: FxDxF family PEP-CTERM protein [unclassified Roseateles]|uniref:FxDxF family PEP-CTERM protein n=1 Tax=unclassified Roseateles TaxID=2626991 RepID=UPI0022B91147|nr:MULTISPECIES: FxDxF family PEP-CTERM protein [unclassified Roseateles]MCZ7880142.1 FxDxF family PEP-CTERM protein [Paucibacter sp. M5-1]MDC6169562.1 FxDxF family PEP-CTERM protein [Paucibacter sp. XJ19-41]